MRKAEDGQLTNGYPNKILKTIGKKWVFLVIREIDKNGKIRFNQLKTNFGKITSSQLSSILKELEENDLVFREIFEEQPARVEYSITEKGKEFLDSFQPFLEWIHDEKNEKAKISEFRDPNLLKALVSLAVEKALLEIDNNTYEKVTERLEDEYKSYLPDCYEHPEYLNEILKDLYGDGFLAIVKTINKNLKEFSEKKSIAEFLEKIGKR